MLRKLLSRKAEPPSERGIVWPQWTGFRGKTVWHWMDLLIVPLMLVALGFWFTTQQEARQQQIATNQEEHQQQLEDQRADQAQQLENQRSQDTALQAYFDSVTNLLIDEHGTQLRKLDPDTQVQSLIQARTETLFAIIDKNREVSVVLFLARSDIIPKGDPLVSLAGINLSFIDFRGIDLSDTSLAGSNLSDAILAKVDLSGSDLAKANLIGANLSSANLRGADLSKADLMHADLSDADLTGANLIGAYLIGANLRGADLSDADLSPALLTRADLRDAKLSGANLSDAVGITNEELEQQAASLEGATMPNGQKYEEWLKDKKAQGKNEKNE